MALEIRNGNTVAAALRMSAAALAGNAGLQAEVAAYPAKRANIIQIINAAAAKLDATGAWPSHDFAPYHIELEFGDAIVTKWGSLPSGPQKTERTFTVDPENPLRISIGVDLVNSPSFQAISAQPGIGAVDALALLLAHEAFHLREPDHMSRCWVPVTETKSGFARALHPDFSEPWRVAMRSLASAFPFQREPGSPFDRPATLKVWQAADIANEACNDLLALRELTPPRFNQAALTAALTAKRQAEEASAQGSRLDLNGMVASPDYQVGAALLAHAPLCQGTDAWPIREQLWRAAFQTALAEPTFLPHEAREAITAALQSPARAPQPPAKKSLIKRLFG